jgi:hypothetical protein
MRRALLFVLLVVSIGALAGSTAVSRPALGATCDPIQTPPTFAGQTPTAQTVLGFGLGSQEVTAAEADEYVQAVDAASSRVVSGVLATSWDGRPLRYALVGKPGNVTSAGLAAIQAATQRLRDPATPPAEAASLAAQTPAILWLMGNVHGGEESGTDAELRVLYELADRTDCAATQILDNALVGIIPTQNPDGREAETRQNAYFFDMKRDWFARTQRETDGKLELLRRYPGVMHIDAHEQGGNHFFFPPAADPIYHEVTAESVHFTDDLFGAAMRAEFDRQHIQYFNDKVYDFFAMVYGNTVPSVAFGSGGMTFEKANFAPIASGRTSTTSPTGCRSLRRRRTASRSARLARLVGRRPHAGCRGATPGEPRQRQGEHRAAPGARHPGAALLPPRRRSRQDGRGPVARTPPAADGRGRVPADRAALGCRLHPLRPGADADRAAVRHVLGADGAGREALDPGAPQRGHVRPLPLLLRRLGLEQPTALQRRRRALRRDPLPCRGAR